MPFQKDIARRPQIDSVFVDLAGRDGLWFTDRGLAEAGAQDSLGEILRKAVGPTSTSLAVKSVSTVEDFAKRSRVTGPVTSRSSSSGGVE